MIEIGCKMPKRFFSSIVALLAAVWILVSLFSLTAHMQVTRMCGFGKLWLAEAFSTE
jgi:hypothetical protein